MFATIILVSFAAEYIGVHTGKLFGLYYYNPSSTVNGFLWGGVPPLVTFSYISMGYVCYVIARIIFNAHGKIWRALSSLMDSKKTFLFRIRIISFFAIFIGGLIFYRLFSLQVVKTQAYSDMADSRVLRGQSKAFPDAEPGSIVKKLVSAQTKNPVILLDELDRVSDDSRADIMGVLIELLDPEQNFAFTDHYIDYPFDLSNVLFVATANNTKNISTAVLDRLEIIQMPSYTDQEKTTIAKAYLFNRIKTNIGLSEQQIQIDDAVWPLLIRPLGFDSGIRSLERLIEGMCRKVARMIVEGKATGVKIDGTNIKQFLPQW
jgi:ATP-dependent Lon protease